MHILAMLSGLQRRVLKGGAQRCHPRAVVGSLPSHRFLGAVHSQSNALPHCELVVGAGSEMKKRENR